MTPTHFAVDAGSAKGLWIEFQDSAYNVGIDNTEYSLVAVPEPAAALLLALDLAGIGLVRRAQAG